MINFPDFKFMRIENMAKNKMLKKHQEVEDDFDFPLSGPGMMDMPFDEEVMAGIMTGLIEASNNQMLLAIELTKLAVDKSYSPKDINVDDVFSIFKKASEVIADSFPLKTLMEQLPSNN